MVKARRPLVSIIIVNWNGENFLAPCLESIRNQESPEVLIETILIDNGSGDNSVKLVKKSYPDVRIIENKTNFGFAEGNNQGYRLAQGNYILLLNNDATLAPGAVSKMVLFMGGRDDIGVVQPKIYFQQSRDILDSQGSYLARYGFLLNTFKIKDDGDLTPRPIFSAKGACMMIRREVIEKLGLFDPDFFVYFEESDFCWRVWLAGWRVYYFPRPAARHLVGQSSHKLSSAEIDFHAFKNRLCSLLKNYEKANLVKILPRHILICLGVSLLFLTKGKSANCRAILKAMGWNLFKVSETWRKRQQVKKIRVTTDKALWEMIGKETPLMNYRKNLSGYLKRW